MKRCCLFIILIAMILVLFQPAYAAFESPVEGIANTLDFSEIEEYVEKVDEEVKQYLPEFSLQEIYQKLREGNFDWNVRDIFTGLLRYFFKEVVANGSLLTRLLILAVASMILTNLQSAFDKGNISVLSHSVIYLVLITIALGSFTVAVQIGRDAIDNMTGVVYAIMPMLLTLLAATGGVTSAALIHPAMLMILGVSTNMIKVVIFPLIYFSVVLNIVSHISPQLKVNRLAGIFKDLAMGFFGIVMTIFVGFLGMQGLAGSVADGLTVKAAKFATGAFIPVVGKSLADALDTVIGTSLILKNGIGLLGVIIIFCLCAVPAVKILAISLIYRVVAAVIQPFGDTQLADALQGLANSLVLVFAAVAAVGLMFFFIITITVCTGNIAMMFR